MEIEPKYCDVVVERWETYTGRKVELLRDPGSVRPHEHGEVMARAASASS
jgi:hypothetical protein